MRRIFRFSLKTLPKYAGSRKVMQQGANNATRPARKAARKDEITRTDGMIRD
jgi:hypothetical protein